MQKSSSSNTPSNVEGTLKEPNVHDDRFPFCLVWTPIPLLTWLLPFVGHLGIGNSQGVTYDFAGPYTINEADLAFGKTARYIILDIAKIKNPNQRQPQALDEAIRRGNELYSGRMHNLICDNCHSHVATILDDLEYAGFRHWNMIILALWIFFMGKFTGVRGFLVTFGPFAVIVGVIVALASL